MNATGAPSTSDNLWQGLDWTAGALSRRARSRLKTAATGLVLALVAGGTIHYSGAVTPRISADQFGWGGSVRIGWEEQLRPLATTQVFTDVTLWNHSWTAETVIGLGADLPGMRFKELAQNGLREASNGGFQYGTWPIIQPTIMPQSTEAHFQLRYEVTDCAAVPSTPQAIPVRVARFWGVQTVHVLLPALRPQDGGYQITTRDDPHHIEWQRFLADEVCGTRREAPSRFANG